MLSDDMIPNFTDKTPANARKWWDAMLEKGFYVHPEDDPSDIVNVGTGERSFDDSACRKITRVYDDMFEAVGESDTYDIAQHAWYNHQGWEWSQEKGEFVERPKNH